MIAEEKEPKETASVEKRAKRKKRIRIVLVLLILLMMIPGFLRVTQVQVEGNQYYTEQEIEDLVFPDSFSRSPLLIFLNERLGNYREIPFVQKYRVTLTGLTSAKITVYEKSMVGYVEFMGSCLYFDKDGMVVESSKEHYGSVPKVTGLQMDYIVLNQKLPVVDDVIFQELLQMTQYFSSTMITFGDMESDMISLVDGIHFDSHENVSCTIGDIEISFGSGEQMEGKLQEMHDILPKLYGRKGTLHLETYDETVTEPSYVFRNRE